MIKILLLIILVLTTSPLNIYSIGTSICVLNQNPTLNNTLVSDYAVLATKIDGTLNQTIINTFDVDYKTAFTNIYGFLPYNCMNITYPESSNYNTLRITQNDLVVDSQFPYAIYRVKNENEVRHAIISVNNINTDNSLKILVRSGAHDYQGLSSKNNTFIIDVKMMNDLHIDKTNNIAMIYTGNTNVNIYTRLAQNDLTAVLGYSPTVGAGLFHSAGFSPYLRNKGLAINGIDAFRVVLPNGTIVNANKDLNADLFWAIRGGGSGNFGVTIYFNVTTFELPKGAAFFNEKGVLFANVFLYSADNFAKIMTVYENQTMIAPDYFEPIIQYKTDFQLGIDVIIFGGYCNGKLLQCVNALEKYTSKFPLPYQTPVFLPVDFYTAWVDVLSGCTPPVVTFDTETNMYTCTDPLDNYGYYDVVDFVVNEYIDYATAFKIAELVASTKVNGGKSFITLSPSNGQVLKKNATDNPFPHRSGKYGILGFVIAGQNLTQFETNRDLVKQAFIDLIAPHTTVKYNHNGVNYTFPTMRRDAPFVNNYTKCDLCRGHYSPANCERLIGIKNVVDPNDRFSYNYSIPLIC